MTKKLEDMDFSEIEKRFIAQTGDMEIILPIKTSKRALQKVLNFFENYGSTKDNLK